MATYGGYAQEYFVKNNSNIDATPIYSVLSQYGQALPDLSGVTVGSIGRTFNKDEANADGLLMGGADVDLNSAVTLTLKFALTNAEYTINDFTFELKYIENHVEKSKELEAYLGSDGRYWVDVENIPAAYWDYEYVIAVTNTKTNTVSMPSGSVLAFVQLKLKNANSTEEVKNLVKGMYYYNEAANEFFGK